MLFYFSISAFLWLLAGVSGALSLKRNFFTYCCAICFILVAGLRFHVGYDWPAYERVFDNTNVILDAISTKEISPPSQEVQKMDFLYELLNSLVKSVGLDFQGLLFVIALTNALVMTNVLKRYSINPSLCFALYFGVAYLGAQMIVMRQALASSFILLAFFSKIENKQTRVWLYSLTALGVHFSTILFFPLLFGIRNRLSILWVLLLLFLMISVGGPVEIFSLLATMLTSYFDVGMIFEKIIWYASGADGYVDEISVGSFGYVVINIFMLWLIHVRMKDLSVNKAESSINIVAYNLTAFMLLAQIGLYQFPSFWNRVQLVALVFQSIFLANFISKMTLQLKIISMLMMCFICNVILFYFLSKDSASEFIPYKTIISRWF